MFRSIILYLLLKNYDQSKSNSPILLLTLLESQLYNSPWIFQKMGPFLTRLAPCANGIYTRACARLNICYFLSPLSKRFFDLSCVCALIGPVTSGTAIVRRFAGKSLPA
jgi:hypothetical protein